MSSFQLPDLYMPYPARLNPNVESTRVHTKAWTMQMGMIGRPGGTTGTAFTWDEGNFDAHEFALLCGYTQHPCSRVNYHPDLSFRTCITFRLPDLTPTDSLKKMVRCFTFPDPIYLSIADDTC